jgi:hypothetical protein
LGSGVAVRAEVVAMTTSLVGLLNSFVKSPAERASCYEIHASMLIRMTICPEVSHAGTLPRMWTSLVQTNAIATW